jgi:uncharacterized HAD superfamily protein
MSTKYSTFDMEKKIAELGGEEQFHEFLNQKERNPYYKSQALEYLEKRKEILESKHQHEEVIALTIEANDIARSSKSLASRANLIAVSALVISVIIALIQVVISIKTTP